MQGNALFVILNPSAFVALSETKGLRDPSLRSGMTLRVRFFATVRMTFWVSFNSFVRGRNAGKDKRSHQDYPFLSPISFA